MTSDEPRIIGTLRADGTGRARMEDRFDTDPADLWAALTDPVRLARWLGEVEGDLRLHGEFRAHFAASGWEGRGRVAACDPPRRLLVVTTGQGESEERGIPLDQLAAYGAGLQVHVEDLAAHLAGASGATRRSGGSRSSRPTSSSPSTRAGRTGPERRRPHLVRVVDERA